MLAGAATGLLRPEFTRFAELWAVGDQGRRQRLWVERDGRVAEIESSILNRGKIKAFAISPDGVRMALIRQVDGRTELGLPTASCAESGSGSTAGCPWT